MKFIDLVSGRYSVRAYEQRPVEKEKLDYILECARMAPSACNKQPWKLYVLGGDRKKAFDKVYDREWFAQAPIAIVVCADHAASWKRPADGKDHSDVDTAIIFDHLLLAAYEQGLSTCWICNFDVPFCKEFLQLPDNMEPVSITPLGYGLGVTRPKSRKSADEIIEVLE